MSSGIIVACRMNSRRLPGKTLANVHGKPLLWYVCEKAKQATDEGVELVVATSDKWHDDPIEDFCQSQRIACFRGDLNDVAGRFLACARQFGFDAFARANGDSPFLPAELLAEAFEVLAKGNLDFVTNLATRTYPYGVAAEVARTDWYEQWIANITDNQQREHVTASVYPKLNAVQHHSLVRVGDNLSHVRLTVDTPSDLDWFRRFIAAQTADWKTIDFTVAVQQLQTTLRRAE